MSVCVCVCVCQQVIHQCGKGGDEKYFMMSHDIYSNYVRVCDLNL